MHVESSTGTKRDFPNFDSRIARIPFCRSTSPVSSASASPGRRPVALRSPIRVTKVSARSPLGESSLAASSINRVISCSVKMCGLLRRRRAASNRRGGTSVRGSMVLSQEANRLTMPSRRAHVARCTTLGSIAQRRASSEVMNSAPCRSRKSTNLTSVMAGSWSCVPRARRSATYCTRASCMAIIGHLPELATAGQPRAMPRTTPGHRSPSWCASDVGGPLRSPTWRRRVESF